MYYLVIFVMRENYYINTFRSIIPEYGIREVGERRTTKQIESATSNFLYKLKLIFMYSRKR